MKIATVLFTYNRSLHTRKTLDALANNYELPEKLYIFQDGLKSENDEDEWKKVNCMIKEFAHCSTEIIVSNINKGLAKSVMDGVTYVSDRSDAFIVIEDDCVTDKNFMGFMNQALLKYYKRAEVFAVTGYGYGDNYKKNGYDAYFVGRISSWGWGTWSNRWKGFNPSTNDLMDMQLDKEKSKHMSLWGNDMEISVKNQISGKSDSWAVWWALHVMNRNGYCLAPSVSLVQNIGFDGTGVHAGNTDEFNMSIINDTEIEFFLPDSIYYNFSATTYFMGHFGGGYTALSVDEKKPHIVIYGIGTWFMTNEKYLSENFFIESFIDKNRSGFYAGKEIYSPEEWVVSDSIIIISLLDINTSLEIKSQLIALYNLPERQVKTLGECIIES